MDSCIKREGPCVAGQLCLYLCPCGSSSSLSTILVMPAWSKRATTQVLPSRPTILGRGCFHRDTRKYNVMMKRERTMCDDGEGEGEGEG